MDNNNDKNQEIIILNNVFYNKPSQLYVFKKIGKISNAIYLITNLINDNEPIKWSLRKEAINSMSFINSIKDTSFRSREIISNLTLIKYLLNIGKTGNIISEMNFVVLDKEIGETIVSLSNSMYGEHILEEGFFAVEKNITNENIKISKDHVYKGQSNVFYNKPMSFIKNPDKKVIPRELKDKQKDERRNDILNIIKAKPNLTIKDISSVVKGCSEKTIQRELISMLSDGIIKKTGERRWSRYSIV